MRRRPFRLYLITDRRLALRHGGLIAVVEAVLGAAAKSSPPAAVGVQLREKDLAAREQYELARSLRALCTRWGAPLLVNDRLDVALAAGADGVHLPSTSFDAGDARRLMGSSALIGVSTHSSDEIARARAAGADFVVFGPVYESISKAGYSNATGGGDTLAEACRAASGMPVYALGGITPERVRRLHGQFGQNDGPAGVAVIGSVFGADNPARAALELLDALAEWF